MGSNRVGAGAAPLSQSPGARARRVLYYASPPNENPMEIEFSHNVDNVLKEAKKQNKPVLLDFSAAPM